MSIEIIFTNLESVFFGRFTSSKSSGRFKSFKRTQQNNQEMTTTLDVPDIEPGDYYKLNPEKKYILESSTNDDLEIGKGLYKPIIHSASENNNNTCNKYKKSNNYNSFTYKTLMICINYFT